MGLLFDAVAPGLLEVARRLVPTASQAEDLVQVTFLVAIERASTFDDTRPVRPWLAGILAKEALKHRRREAREVWGDRLPSRSAPLPEDVVSQAEVHEILESSIETLNEPQRRLLRSHLLEGQTAVEISRDTGPSAAQIRVQIGRALQRLRDRLPRGLTLGGWMGTRAISPRKVRSEVVRASQRQWTSPARDAGALTSSLTPFTLGAAVLTQATTLAAAGLCLALGLFFVLTTDGASEMEPVASPPQPPAASGSGTAPLREPIAAQGTDRVAAVSATPSAAKVEAVSDTDPSQGSGPWFGRVIDERGLAAGDATLEVRFDRSGGRSRERFPVLDGSGRFEIPAFSEPALLCALRLGRVSSQVVLLDQSKQDRAIELQLRGPGARLGIRVQDPSGVGIPGLRLLVHEDGIGGQFHRTGFVGLGWLWSAETDVDGLAVLEDLAPFAHTIEMPGHGLPPSLISQRQMSPPLKAGAERTMTLRLDEGATLFGRVTDTAGHPVAAAWIWAGEGQKARSSSADDGGHFELRGIPHGLTKLSVRSSNHAFKEVPHEMTLEAGVAERWDPVVGVRDRWHGQLLDEAGDALVGWNISVHTRTVNGIMTSTKTAAEGRFALQGGLPTGRFISAQNVPHFDDREPMAVFLELPLEASSEADAVQLIVDEASLQQAVITGRLVHGSGEPAQGMRFEIASVAQGQSLIVPVPETGVFRIERPLSDTYDLRFLCGADSTFPLGRQSARLDRGRTVDLGEIIVARPGALTLDLRLPATEPSDLGSARPQRPRGRQSWRFEPSDGRKWGTPAVVTAGAPWDSDFGLAGDEPLVIPPGNYLVHLEATHYLVDPFPVTVRAGESVNVSVALQSATLVQLDFNRDTGEPLDGPVNVEILHGSTGAQLATHEVPFGERLALELEPIEGGRRIRVSAMGSVGERWAGELAGRLSGGHRRDHLHTVVLRPQ